jgi:hypothetical protein
MVTFLMANTGIESYFHWKIVLLQAVSAQKELLALHLMSSHKTALQVFPQ